jgi:hypothetical protein
MGTKTNPGKFNCYAAALPDEEVFTVLGRDPALPATIRFWMGERARLGKAVEPDDVERLGEAGIIADRAAAWREKHLNPMGDGVPTWKLPRPADLNDDPPVRMLPSVEEVTLIQKITIGLRQVMTTIDESAMMKHLEVQNWRDRIAGYAAELEAEVAETSIWNEDPPVAEQEPLRSAKHAAEALQTGIAYLELHGLASRLLENMNRDWERIDASSTETQATSAKLRKFLDRNPPREITEMRTGGPESGCDAGLMSPGVQPDPRFARLRDAVRGLNTGFNALALIDELDKDNQWWRQRDTEWTLAFGVHEDGSISRTRRWTREETNSAPVAEKPPVVDTAPDDLAHAPEVPHHRFSVFHAGESYAYARGLEVSPMHLPTALDAMEKSGWGLVAIFGATDSKHIGFVFERVGQYSAFEIAHGYGGGFDTATRRTRETDNEKLRQFTEGAPLGEIYDPKKPLELDRAGFLGEETLELREEDEAPLTEPENRHDAAPTSDTGRGQEP